MEQAASAAMDYSDYPLLGPTPTFLVEERARGRSSHRTVSPRRGPPFARSRTLERPATTPPLERRWQLSRSFFYTQRPLNRPGVDLDRELLSDQVHQGTRSNGLARLMVALNE